MIEDWSKLGDCQGVPAPDPVPHPRLDCLNLFGPNGLHRVEERAVFAIEERFEVKLRIEDLQLTLDVGCFGRGE
jgi:hypothetical protein